MPNHRHSPPLSKPQGTTGISPTDSKNLTLRVEALEKFIKEQFDEKNQWNSLVREWIGSTVELQLVTGKSVLGTLRWIDRYTLCIEISGKPAVVHKAALAVIQQVFTGG